LAGAISRPRSDVSPDRKAQTDLRNVVLREGGYNAHSRCKSVEGCGSGGKAGRNRNLGAVQEDIEVSHGLT